jgi:hypothetical protein
MRGNGWCFGLALLCTSCANLESGYDCPRIIPQAAYDRFIALSTIRSVPLSELPAMCQRDKVLGCVHPWMQGGAVVQADMYVATELSEAAREGVVLHEICHLYELDSGAKTPEQTLVHDGWLVR